MSKVTRSSLQLAVAVLLVVGVTACGRPSLLSEDEDPGAIGAISQSVTVGPLYFDPASGLDLRTVLSRIERSMYKAMGTPPVVVVEANAHDTSGKFSLLSFYPSLEYLAAKMKSKDPAYKWDVVSGKHLVVKPVSGAVLDKQVKNFTASGLQPCEVFQNLNTAFAPSKPGQGGCVNRGHPRFVPAQAAYVLRQETVTLSYSGWHTVEEIVLDMLLGLSTPVGASIYEFDSKLHKAWEVRW